jgi:hypothetical protein
MPRPTAIRAYALGVLTGSVLTAGVLVAAPAKADGVLSNAEAAYVIAFGAAAVCPVISQFPTEAGVFGVLMGIMDDGFSADSAVDIVNESVADFCPRHWPLLTAIGNKYRGVPA